MQTLLKSSIKTSKALPRLLPNLNSFAFTTKTESKKTEKSQPFDLREPNLEELTTNKSSFIGSSFENPRNKSLGKKMSNFKESKTTFERKDFDSTVRDVSELAMYPESLEQSGVLSSQIVAAIQEELSKVALENVATLVWSLSRIEFFPTNIRVKCEEVIIREANHLEPSETAIILWGFAKIRAGDKEFWDIVIQRTTDQLSEMSLLDITQVVWGLTRLNHRDPKIWALLENAIMGFKNLTHGQAISLFMMNFAKMGYGSQELWRNLENRFVSGISALEAQSISNGLWALGRREKTIVLTPHALELLVLENYHRLNDAEASSAAWTITKLSNGSKRFWTTVEARATAMIDNSPEQVDLVTLSAFTWILKNYRDLDEEFWARLEYQVLEKKEKIGTNHLYSILASFATRRKGSHIFWRTMDRKATELMDQFTPRDLSNMIWAFATAERGYKELWHLLAEHCKVKVHKMDAQTAVLSLWGLAKSKKTYNPDIIEEILTVLNERFDDLKSVDIGLMMYSAGKILHKSDITKEIVTKVRSKVINDNTEMPMIDVCQSCYAIALLKMGDQELWDAFENIFLTRFEEIQEEGWALIMVSGAEGAEFSEKLWEFSEDQIRKNMPEYSGSAIATIMMAVNRRGHARIELWTMFEEEIKKKMPLLEDTTLADCAYILMKRNISQNEFWICLETVISNRLNEIKLGPLSRLVQSFGQSKQGSLELWSRFQKVLKIKFIEDQYISKNVISNILIGFSTRRKGDHDFWNLLDKKIMDVLREEELTQVELASIVKKLSKVRRGSRRLWAAFFEAFISNIEATRVPTILLASESFVSVKEIDETEKEMLQRMCIDKILVADEDFARLLNQLSFCFFLCQRMPNSEIKKLSQKIEAQSKRVADSGTVSRMQYSLNKIIKNIEIGRETKQDQYQSPSMV